MRLLRLRQVETQNFVAQLGYYLFIVYNLHHIANDINKYNNIV